MTLGDVIETSQMGKAGGSDVASVWSLTTVADNVDTHLALGGLDGGVGLTRGHGVTLGVEEEVMDEGLHVLLHGSSRRGRDLVVLAADGATRHLVQALVDDAKGLSELLHAAEVSVVAVTVGADGDIKLDLVVGIVRLALSDIPWHTGATEHDTGKGEVKSLGGGNNSNTSQSLDPDTIVCQHLLGLVDTVAELSSPLVDVVKKTDRNILVNTAGAHVGGVETGTGDTLVEFLESWSVLIPNQVPLATYHELLSLLKTPKEGSQSTNIHSVREDGHQVVENSSDLAKQGSDKLGSLGDLDIEKLLDTESKALLVGHHGDVVESVEVGESLEVGLVLDQLLGTSVKQTDVRIGSDDLLAIELENQTQHTVSGGMLRTEVDRVVADLAVLDRVLAARLLGGAWLAAGQTVDVLGRAKVFIDGDEPRGHGLDGSILSKGSCREGARGKGCRSQTQTFGACAGESVKGRHCEERVGFDGSDREWVE